MRITKETLKKFLRRLKRSKARKLSAELYNCWQHLKINIYFQGSRHKFSNFFQVAASHHTLFRFEPGRFDSTFECFKKKKLQDVAVFKFVRKTCITQIHSVRKVGTDFIF